MPIGLEDMIWAEEQVVARQVGVEEVMMVEVAGRTVGVEVVIQARPGLVTWARPCRLMKRRRGTYRSMLAREVLPVPPYGHRTL
jgi:hypothetical protein